MGKGIFIQNFELTVNAKGEPIIKFNNFYKSDKVHDMLLQVFCQRVATEGIQLVEVESVIDDKADRAHRKYEIRIGRPKIAGYLEAKNETPDQEGEEDILP